MQRTTRFAATLVVFVSLLIAEDASALFLPPLESPVEDVEVAKKAPKEPRWMPSFDLAVNADARATWEKVTATIQGFPGIPVPDAEVELQTYGARVEWVPYEWLSLQALLGHNTGSNGTIDLTGRIAGAGFSATYGFNPYNPKDKTFLFFGSLNGTYTNSDFRDVSNTINTWTGTLRLGAIKRLGIWIASLYAGPAFQDFTKHQTTKVLQLNGELGYTTFEVQPKSEWNGVIGGTIGIGGCDEAVLAPLSVAIEGGVGDRRYVSGNLRYQWGVEDCPTFHWF